MNNSNLGDRVKEARLEKMMTQKEVAGSFITRNMLSQIENGSATPSIKTIEYLARVLDKPVAYFLDAMVEESLSFAQPPVHNALSEAIEAFELNDYDKCIELIRSIIEQSDSPYSLSDYREIYMLAFTCCFEKGCNLFNSGYLDEASAYLEESLSYEAVTPYKDLFRSAKCLLILSRIYLSNKDMAKAEDYYSKFESAMTPNNLAANGFFTKCDLLIQAERYDECMEHLKTATFGNIADTFKYLYYLGFAQFKNGEYIKAAETFELSLTKSTDKKLLPTLYSCLAECYYKSGSFEKAYECMKLKDETL